MATATLMRYTSRCSTLRVSKALRPASLIIRSVPMATKTIQKDEDFFDKNDRFKRPMSPHILIYSWPQTAVLSVFHRGTGTAYALFTSALGAGYLLTGSFMSFGDYLAFIQSLHLPVWFLFSCKYILTWPVVYHSLNGIRHMVWDTGRGLTLDKLSPTGWLVLGTSLIASGALAYM